MALIGVELHLAVRQRADRLAVLAHVGDQHHRRMRAHELFGMDLGRRAEAFSKPNLIVFGQLLAAQQDDQMLMPGIEHVPGKRIVDGIAQIDADNFRAKCGRQRTHRKGLR
jgi:hypothetical protein